MPRFFANPENIGSDMITLVGDDAYHIARSLRMAVDDTVTVSDGTGITYECTLAKIRDDVCECKIISSAQSSSESPVSVTLYMAYPKGDKLEVVIQKAVELGAVRIVPFESERCIKRPKAEKLDRQLTRLNKIAEEAAKQSGRDRLPEVARPVTFSEMLESASDDALALFCYEGESKRTLKAVLEENRDAKKISVIVGCEGGFSEEEAMAARAAGCASVTLGKRILRCETAPSYVLSAISYCFEL